MILGVALLAGCSSTPAPEVPGQPPQLAPFPLRVKHALGVHTYFASNAAGGIRRDLSAVDLMIIEDHLNLTGQNPLTGHVEKGDERFPDMSAPYDAELRALLRKSAANVGVDVKEGVYAWLPVPEVIVARAIGLRVAGMSCIANAASGVTDAPVLHADVLEVTARAAKSFQALVKDFVGALPKAK